MNRRLNSLLAGLALLAMIAASTQSGVSRQATPAAASQGLTLAAGGLVEPAGFTWAPDGTLYVAEASGTADSNGHATPAATMPSGSLDGAIIRVVDGCPVVYQSNLPSSGTPDGDNVGPVGLGFLNGQLYLLDEGGGPDHGNPLTPDGIYRIPGDGSVPLVADIHQWVSNNPVSNPSENPAGSDVTGMAIHDGAFLVVGSEQGQILRVTVDGDIERVADLSSEDAKPRGIAVTPGGDVLVGLGSRIVSIDTDGKTTDAWADLDAVVDITVASNGTVYALQADGTVLRQSTDGAREVANGFSTPAAIGIGPDGGLYVTTTPADNPQAGGLVRIDTDQGQVMTMSDALLTESDCIAQPTPTATTSATPDATPDAAATPDDGDDDASGDGQTVNISNFAFDPTSITVSAGTTITWTNNDTVAHTVTANDGSFDSGNLAPGDSFSFTFSDSGTFDYACMYHPNMQATVVVN